jgi:hypothetical protein
VSLFASTGDAPPFLQSTLNEFDAGTVFSPRPKAINPFVGGALTIAIASFTSRSTRTLL